MQASDAPLKLPIPFANTGSKATIPETSQIGVGDSARASLPDGFPPITRLSLGAGGIPPYGLDFNGILNEATAINRWSNAGGFYKYDSTFSAKIGGYPKGAVLISSNGIDFWESTAENNTTDPDANTTVNWIPFGGKYKRVIELNAANTLTDASAWGNLYALTGASSFLTTLPSPSVLNRGRTLTFVNFNTATISYNLATPAGAFVASYPFTNPTTLTLYPGEKIELTSDSSNWFISSWNRVTNPVFNQPSFLNGASFGNVANANPLVLDWYERGNWSPLIGGSTSFGTFTPTLQDGFFVREGKRVDFRGNIGWTGLTGTGALIMAGIPYSQLAGVDSLDLGSYSGLNFGVNKDPRVYMANSVITFSVCDPAGGAPSNLGVTTSGSAYVSGHYFLP